MTIMRRLRSAGLAGAAAATFAAAPAPAQNWEADGAAFAAMLKEARRADWDHARSLAASVTDPVALSVHEWLRLRDGSDNWEDYQRFLAQHADWPGLKILRLAGEQAIGPTDDPHRIIAYFSDQPPQSGIGAVRLAEAYRRLDRHRQASGAIINGWLSLPFATPSMPAALAGFASTLKPHHAARLDNLLWEGRFDEARQMFGVAGRDQERLAGARIALREQARGVDAAIAKVPGHLRDDPGLAFERVIWRLRNDAETRAIELLLERSVSAASLGKPELWAARRLGIAHSLMSQGKARLAYQVASSHFMQPAPGQPDWLADAQRQRAFNAARGNFIELEWLSGYIALRQLGEPELAIHHFRRQDSQVASPIGRGKAGYWLGLAHEAAGEPVQALSAFNRAALRQTSFYGQLAAQRISAGTDPGLIGRRQPVAGRPDRFSHLPVVRAALLFHHAGEDSFAAWFMAHWAERLDEDETMELAALARRHGAEFSVVKVAKEGVKRGHIDIEHLFPLTGIEEYILPIPHAVAISIARQETEFRDTAVSPRGAIGLMQIKPSTGQEIADNLGLPGSIKRLLRNRETNVRIGAEYIRELLEQFGGSYVLAIASYNAGPARVAGWTEEIGDPRHPGIDPIDWIEHIPYGETRNYVMRVLEAITVYRIRLGGTASPINLAGDLQRR